MADAIRGQKVGDARVSLSFAGKRATHALKKLLDSAVANARANFKLEEANLVVREIRVDQGPTLKRFMPRAFGRSSPIRKRTCHVTLILGTK